MMEKDKDMCVKEQLHPLLVKDQLLREKCTIRERERRKTLRVNMKHNLLARTSIRQGNSSLWEVGNPHYLMTFKTRLTIRWLSLHWYLRR